ncbi:MAG TPA: magnesium transporter CorA family protein, partial [Capillimicrobium sp.]|nr:magnesium transporter CorA family protein [Capillimicrobium sp.]
MLTLSDPDAAALEDARRRGEYVWVDLLDPADDVLRRTSQVLGVHPLALEDSEEFSQRPKLDHYGDHLLLVFYGARLEEDGAISLVETHLVVGAQWLVTVRRHPCLSLDTLHDRGLADPGDDRWIVYRVVDALTDSYFPVLNEIDQRVDQLEEEVLEGRVRDARRDTVVLRKPVLKIGRVLGAQRDVFDRSVPDLIRTPSLGPGAAAYLRDVQDHLHRLTDRADAERDRLTGLVHLSEDMTNTRLAAASERFALIATIFLPLTAVSSFFGMNFSWMV